MPIDVTCPGCLVRFKVSAQHAGKKGLCPKCKHEILVPSLDEEKPATLSPRIVQAMLREEIGFTGVILSDDLEMKAIAKTYSVPDSAVQAIAAGCDGLLVCSGNVEVQATALEALYRITRPKPTITRIVRKRIQSVFSFAISCAAPRPIV